MFESPEPGPGWERGKGALAQPVCPTPALKAKLPGAAHANSRKLTRFGEGSP